MDTNVKHGGAGRGQGRKPLDAEQGARIKCAITLKKEHFERTKGSRSKIIDEALEDFFKKTGQGAPT